MMTHHASKRGLPSQQILTQATAMSLRDPCQLHHSLGITQQHSNHWPAADMVQGVKQNHGLQVSQAIPVTNIPDDLDTCHRALPRQPQSSVLAESLGPQRNWSPARQNLTLSGLQSSWQSPLSLHVTTVCGARPPVVYGTTAGTALG